MFDFAFFDKYWNKFAHGEPNLMVSELPEKGCGYFNILKSYSPDMAIRTIERYYSQQGCDCQTDKPMKTDDALFIERPTLAYAKEKITEFKSEAGVQSELNV